jgi:hypothetical protein
MTPLCFCGQPVADNARACNDCTHYLEQDLAEIPALADELRLAIAKQTTLHGGSYTGPRPVTDERLAEREAERVEQAKLEDLVASVHVQALPYDVNASNASEHLRVTLVCWVRLIVDERGARWPENTLSALSSMLLGNLPWLRHHPSSEQAYPDLQSAVSRAKWAIDRHPDQVYAGPCDPTGEYHPTEHDLPGPCTRDLYANPGKEYVRCDRCLEDWNVAERRTYLLEAAEDMLVTAADLSRFLTVYGEPVTGERVRKWAERGQLIAHGQNARAHPVYRVGDAVDLLSRMDRKAS